ncbi:hypothetical protein [Kitasatospora sp. GP82]|uniref:hypothetical protein n=1 Tax=Kitasatospora sp. GP82 TaxID=3035089 RepID=UPI0024745AF4|nr:hypothetical protein [Kitasatospora sp. GP82]MDH6128856.1 hypothetical protein [Kitasatospora sp. GP82]
MTDTGGIRLNLAGIEAALERNGHDSCHIEFVPDRPGGSRWDGDNTDLLAATEAALAAADRDGTDDAMWGQGPVLTLDGTGLTLKGYAGPASLTTWLEDFSTSLRQQGQSGLVRATSSVMPPHWLRHGRELRATAFVALDHALTGRADVLLWGERAASWAAHAGGTAHLSATPILQHDPAGPAEIAAHLTATLRGSDTATLMQYEEAEARAARVFVQRDGLAVYQAYDPALPWTELIDRVRDAVVAEAPSARLAFVAMTGLWAYSWEDRGRQLPALPTISTTDLRANHSVWSRHVPDAHGIQLLTGAHLDRAEDLSGWSVTEIRPDRFLVEDRNPDAWFSPDGPDPELVERARRDFGRLIIPDGPVGGSER